jgi:predicted dienelactone hydrolase
MQDTKIFRYLESCLLMAATVITTGMSGGAGAPDPGLPGPYAVGHTTFLLFDTSRLSDNFPTGRPIPVYVWYPVDPADVGPGTPDAVYPLDPYNHSWPPVTSSDWEVWGVDHAYQEPAPSSDGPFPLLLHSHGWGGGQIPVVSMHGPRLASHGFVVAGVTHMADTGFMNFMDPQ